MTLEEAFPKVDAGAEGLGGRVLIQLRTAKEKSQGGILLVEESKDFEKWNTAVGKVIQVGPIAYKDRDTGIPWPEGAWVREGDFVRVPKWGGDRWEVPVDGNPNSMRDPTVPKARFVIYNDREIIGRITGDPLAFIDYV